MFFFCLQIGPSHRKAIASEIAGGGEMEKIAEEFSGKKFQK